MNYSQLWDTSLVVQNLINYNNSVTSYVKSLVARVKVCARLIICRATSSAEACSCVSLRRATASRRQLANGRPAVT